MQIPPDRAFRMLERYRRSRRQLAFAGYMLGCVHACPARVTSVWTEKRCIAITLVEGDGRRSWECFVPLDGATFWSNLEEESPVLKKLSVQKSGAVLRVMFPDGTEIVLSDRPGAGDGFAIAEA